MENGLFDQWGQIEKIIDSGKIVINTESPSDWIKKRVIVEGAFPGFVNYDLTPFWKPIVDKFSPDHPMREFALMGAAQTGKTSAIIMPLICYFIENAPANIIATVGNVNLLKEFAEKIDKVFDKTGITTNYIGYQGNRARNQKSGNTDRIKQFPGGYLKISDASNPNVWRQSDFAIGFIDDYDAVNSGSKRAGDTHALVAKRFTSYHSRRKIMYCSSPELEHSSNVYKIFKLGDQCYWNVPCPCCGAYIVLSWDAKSKYGDKAGMTYKLDDEDKLVIGSVGYTCQECGGFFDDSNKQVWVNKGEWIPTSKPQRTGFESCQMPAWYSPHGTTNWEAYVEEFLLCNPPKQKRKEREYQTFRNVNEGLPYAPSGDSIEVSELQKNTKPYEVGEIPESLSIRHGNGNIVLLTCACDLGGHEDDARLDYEVVAWSENESSYSVTHGSIGTFKSGDSQKEYKEDRVKWTYHENMPNSIWPEIEKVLGADYYTDGDRKMRIFATGVDTGHYTKLAYNYVDTSRHNVVALKGDKEQEYRKMGLDTPNFKIARERLNLYILQVGQIKDDISRLVSLKDSNRSDIPQPSGFMNFPTPSGGKYTYNDYFSHYGAENKVMLVKDNQELAFMWKKVNSHAQNHFFDVRVYNMAMKDIIVAEMGKSLGEKRFGWKEFVDFVIKNS